jgi:hypothetical protein
MKGMILRDWNFMRIFRIVFGIAIFVRSIFDADLLLAIAGLFFIGMAVLNVSCCGMGACPTNPKGNGNATKDISYEEIK